MIRRIDPFDLYHFGLGAICLAAFVLGCAPPPNQMPDDSAPPARDSTVDPANLDADRKAKVDIDIGGGNGVNVDVEGRRSVNPAD